MTAPTRILWTSNIDLPAAAPGLGLKATPFGGWLSLMTDQLARLSGYEIAVAMRSESKTFQRVETGGITYYALPQQRDRFDVAQADVDRVLADFKPDILHVEGAEMRHARRFLSTWTGPRLLSMQGVLNGIRPYQLGALPIARMLVPWPARHTLVAVALLTNYWRNFVPRLASERQAMGLTNNVMGRTLWDRAQAARMAPQARYFHCPRILRDVFYTTQWVERNGRPFSIFMGNASVPLKGAHVAVQALALLKRDYPDVTLSIAGEDPRKLPRTSLKRHVGYPVYLLDLISKLGVEDNVRFTGLLSAQQMADQMAGSHICLMASIIENSPNTLAEAMILGTPTVSAYAGGAPSMARDEMDALFYRPDDPAMLALQIRRLFEDPDLAARLSQSARARAQAAHAPAGPVKALVAAYETIMADEKGPAA